MFFNILLVYFFPECGIADDRPGQEAQPDQEKVPFHKLSGVIPKVIENRWNCKKDK
jgi:hypothetical protein